MLVIIYIKLVAEHLADKELTCCEQQMLGAISNTLV